LDENRNRSLSPTAKPFPEYDQKCRELILSTTIQSLRTENFRVQTHGRIDQMIRVWNATAGETVAGPFIGHSSVAFSPDGQHIVSGSEDETIRAWNTTTGETVTGPFNGHSDWVRSMAFSPDGQRIVSGSWDRTIRVWNVTTGETVAGPFVGHPSSVTSVAFSPDGQHIVSGSSDRTIHAWNATTGETVTSPFVGHSDRIMSVTFSPDGQHIASGSYDRTIRFWKAMTRKTETETTGQVGFTDQSKINDEGWICSNDELLMWIPPVHRDGLHRPSNIWVAAEHETRLDISTFVHGHSWSTCIKT